ncbi:MTRF1L release factor glutamine methyltransferase isoform X2 [Mastacembelus armatus]|uniref:MTRF1L release factor glutamine methyltransferase isoform X2 n=1 Tax=Mastacembelus armatus TaxID=205130 RepID=UPI000E458C49|nr:MTRF1L release factor glutamine methyltransferase isoform X2 [Mastacembelus armatus]
MWRRSVSAGHTCFGLKGIWGFRAVHTCDAPALPAGRITALQAMDLWKRHFEERGVTEPDQSSHYIIAHLLGATTVESLEQRKLTELLSLEKIEQVWKLCTRRLSRMPVQYVIEEWDFRDLTLKMRPPVFIPRPETELKAIALDQSQDAVNLTIENMLRLGLQDRLQIYHLDVIKDAQTLLSLCSPVSVLVSNPPYLFSEDMASLEPEVFRFEDHSALDGGKDGLKVIKQILNLAPQLLLNYGRVYLEVDPRHPQLIRPWLKANVEELHYVETRHDITGRPRFCILQKEKSNKDRELNLGLRN